MDDDSTVDQQSMHVAAPMPVEIESAELQQTPETVAADPESILELGPQHVVGTEDAALGQQLADQPLEADEGSVSGTLAFLMIPTKSCGPETQCRPCYLLFWCWGARGQPQRFVYPSSFPPSLPVFLSLFSFLLTDLGLIHLAIKW